MPPRESRLPIPITEIKSVEAYVEALARVEQLFDAKVGTPQGSELESLLCMVETYEKREFPIDPPHPGEAIRFRMEQKD